MNFKSIVPSANSQIQDYILYSSIKKDEEQAKPTEQKYDVKKKIPNCNCLYGGGSGDQLGKDMRELSAMMLDSMSQQQFGSNSKLSVYILEICKFHFT